MIESFSNPSILSNLLRPLTLLASKLLLHSDRITMGSVDKKFEWNSDTELRLLQCLYGHKPIGIDKSFQLIMIWEKFKILMGRDIPLSVVKEKLKTFYNFEAAELAQGKDQLKLRFPEVEFSLPEDEFPEVYRRENENKENKVP